jgi:Flp pilus assembly protein TadB
MTFLAAAFIAAACALLAGDGRSGRLRATGAAESERTADAPTPHALRAAAALVLGVGLWVLIGGPAGVVVGAMAGVGAVWALGRVGDDGGARFGQELSAQAPDGADMLAACVASGASLERASAEVATAIGGAMGATLGQSAALMELGAAPLRAWQPLAEHEATAPIARAVVRSLDSGAPVADALSACAGELRDIRRAEVEAMAQSVAVRTVGPLGLCFLPAFLLIGVVPLVAGLLESALDGL